MAGAVKELKEASTAEATGRVVMVTSSDAEAVAHRVRTVGHFLRLFEGMSMGGPSGTRLDLCGESFSVVMEDLADRCMAAEREIEQLIGLRRSGA